MSWHQSRPLTQGLAAQLMFGYQQGYWDIPCRDHHGHRVHILIRPTLEAIEIHTPTSNHAFLTALHVGRLRNALRQAAIYHCTWNGNQ